MSQITHIIEAAFCGKCPGHNLEFCHLFSVEFWSGFFPELIPGLGVIFVTVNFITKFFSGKAAAVDQNFQIANPVWLVTEKFQIVNGMFGYGIYHLSGPRPLYGKHIQSPVMSFQSMS